MSRLSHSDSDASSVYDWNSDDEPPQEKAGDERVITSDKMVSKRVLQRGEGYDRPGRTDNVLVQYGPSEDELSEARWVRLGKGKLCCALEIMLRQMRKLEVAEVSYPEGSVYSSTRSPVFNKAKRYLPMAPTPEMRKMNEGNMQRDSLKTDGDAAAHEMKRDSLVTPQNNAMDDGVNDFKKRESSETFTTHNSLEVVSPKMTEEEKTKEDEIPRTRIIAKLVDFKTIRRLTDDGRVTKETITPGCAGRRPAPRDYVTYDVLNEKLEVIESHRQAKIHDLSPEFHKALRSMHVEEVAKVTLEGVQAPIFLRLNQFYRLNEDAGIPKLELAPAPLEFERLRGDSDHMDVCIALSIIEGQPLGLDLEWPAPQILSFHTATGTVPKEIEQCVRTMAVMEDACFEIQEASEPLFTDIPDEVIPPCKDLGNYVELKQFVQPVWDGSKTLISSDPPPIDWAERGEPRVFPELPKGPFVLRLWLIGTSVAPETWNLETEERKQFIALARKVGNKYVENKIFDKAEEAYSRALDALRFEVSELFEVRDPKNVIRALPKEDPPSAEQVNLYVILHCNIAFCASQRENYHQAKEAAESALKQDENCVKALFRRAAAYEGMGDWSKALADLGHLLTLAPQDPLVKQAIQRLQKAMDEHKEVEKDMFKKMF